MNIVVMGPNGSGKSTQAKMLADKLGVPHISSGDIFRSLENQQSSLAVRIKEKLQKGELVDDTDALALVEERLAKEDCIKGFVLDGAPRNLYQAQNTKAKIDLVYYLKVSDETCVKRLLLRARGDDTDEVIKTRLFNYHTLTEPVLDFFRTKNKLIEVDGEKKEEEIFLEIYNSFLEFSK